MKRQGLLSVVALLAAIYAANLLLAIATGESSFTGDVRAVAVPDAELEVSSETVRKIAAKGWWRQPDIVAQLALTADQQTALDAAFSRFYQEYRIRMRALHQHKPDADSSGARWQAWWTDRYRAELGNLESELAFAKRSGEVLDETQMATLAKLKPKALRPGSLPRR